MEKTNREVLKAIKKWDKFVFKKENKYLDHKKTPAMNNPNGQQQQQHQQQHEDYEIDGRPKRKVILLCGPPGTGKTTLAHVVANHCGYRPIEINASDDRSPEFIKESIYRATQNMTLNQDKKPNCIIIDEIDGLDASNKASLDLLVEILNAPMTTHSHSSSSSSGDKKKKSGSNNQKKDIFPLTRPLICICNDQYAPVLREIKKAAEVFLFHLPQDLRLVSRLQQICKEEDIILPSTSILNELIVATGHDIRSSINNLQFASLHLHRQEKTNPNITSKAAASLSMKEDEMKKKKIIENILENMLRIGLKDDHLDAYQIWNQVFSKKTTSNNNTSDSAEIAAQQGVVTALDIMSNHGDSSLVTLGIYENMHRISSYYDVGSNNINRHSFSTEWLSWTNQFALSSLLTTNSSVSSSFYDVLSQYSGLIGSAVYYSHAIPNQKPKLEWPKKDREYAYSQVQKSNILALLTDSNYNVFSSIPKEVSNPEKSFSFFAS
jgi:chromosome transmission fidelity protein 18